MTLISIEGNIGSGKENIIQFFKKYFKDDIIFIDDSIYNWKEKQLLKDFYKDPERWSFTLQIKSITQKYKNFLNVLPYKQKGSVIITNRSPMTDYYCFEKSSLENGFVSEIEDKIYKSVFESYKIPQFHGIIYLKSNVNKCYEKIITKDDKIEKYINFDYLISVNKNYEKWISDIKLKKIPLLEIDAEEFRDIDDNEMLQQKLLTQLLKTFPQLKSFSKTRYETKFN